MAYKDLREFMADLESKGLLKRIKTEVDPELEALLSVNKYFDFVIMFVLPFGFIFELPLVMTIMGKMGLITSAFLKKYQRIIIFLSFVVGALITPTPDVFTQSMIALPIIVLYEVGYFIVRYILRR